MVSTVVKRTLSVTHFRAHAGVESRLDGEVLCILARAALGTSSHLLSFGPLAAGAALVRRAVNAVPRTVLVARARLGSTGARAGARARRVGARGRAGAGARGAGARVRARARAGRTRCSGLGRSGSRRAGRRARVGSKATRGSRLGSSGSTTATNVDTDGSADRSTAAAAATATTTELGGTSAGLLTLRHEVAGGTVVLDIVTRVGEAEVLGLGSGAAVDVGDEHAGEIAAALLNGSLLFGALGGATLDGDGSAVHVHLTVTDAVEPGPGHGVLATADAIGDGEVEVSGDLVGLTAREVTLRVDGAATLNGLDDHPVGVLGRIAVRGQANLARTTTVGSTALEGQRDGVTNAVGVFLAHVVDTGALLAGEVTAISRQRRVVQRVLAIGHRVGHDQMSVDRRDTQKGGSQDVLESHCVRIVRFGVFEVFVFFFFLLTVRQLDKKEI